jgi:hypothetical protein
LNISTILTAIFILIIDVVLIRIHIKNKLIFIGQNKYRVIMPVTIVVFIIITLASKSFKVEDIIISVLILPLAFVGNKSGITEKGLLMKSYLTTWDKVESYSLEEKNNRYIVYYKSNVGQKRIFFKEEDKDEVKKYLLGIRKLKYSRK